jgi:inositol 1,4,5-triphosphate receptor type 1
LVFWFKFSFQLLQQIVRADRTLERVVFPMPDECSHLTLTSETRERVHVKTERDTQGSKVAHFFAQWKQLYAEMTWQMQLKQGAFNCCILLCQF